MTRKQFAITAGRVRQEMENIAQLLRELTAKGLFAVDGEDCPLPPLPNDSFYLRSIGSVLHDFYVAVEKIMEAVAKSLDDVLPEGSHWHRELLIQMTLSVPQVRPALLSTETAQYLQEFLGFRHVFRNVYGFSLSADRLEELLRKLPAAAGHLSGDVTHFLAVMEQMLPNGSPSRRVKGAAKS